MHRVAGLTGGRTALVKARLFTPPSTHLGCRADRWGQVLRPGDVSLTHYGVLFLDEQPEFKRYVLEVLRPPLEESLTRK